jgi:putative membrane protein
MISYNPKDWFTFIFRIHKTETLRELWPLLVAIGAYSLGLEYVEEVLLDSKITIQRTQNLGIVYSILGFTLSLFLVFRTNTAYDRWWEGRKLWGQLINANRNLLIHIATFMNREMDTKKRESLGEIIALFPTVLRLHLKDERISPENTKKEIENSSIYVYYEGLYKSTHQPLYLAEQLLILVKGHFYENPEKNGFELELMRTELTAWMDICGACERIKNTPIPFNYSVFIKKFIFIYVMLFPVVYSTQLGLMIAPVTMFILYVLASIELIAEEIENPFNGDDNDLPLEQLASVIERSSEQILLKNKSK